MSLAAETREAVRRRPFLLDALRAGLLNHTAAATWLVDDADLNGDTDAVATALRRFREDLPAYSTESRATTVSMRSGVGLVEADGTEAGVLFHVGDVVVTDGGRHTAIIATGDVDATALSDALGRLVAADVEPLAAGVAGGSLVVVVSRRDGADAVRTVEAGLDAVPST